MNLYHQLNSNYSLRIANATQHISSIVLINECAKLKHDTTDPVYHEHFVNKYI